MYKGAANHLVRRSVATATSTKANTAGVDPTAFAAPDDPEVQRQKLVEEKRDLEGRLTVLNGNITAVKTRRHTVQSSIALDRLMEERQRLIAQRNKLDHALLKLKPVIVHRRENEDADLHSAFFTMAKQILAADVFNRVLVAAVHRASPE